MLKPFNDKAHVIVQELLDLAETTIVRKGICTLENASRYLAIDYIGTCGDFIEHSVQYLENDERIGADLFLAKLATGRLKARFERNSLACALHLTRNTTTYFPEYLPLLRLALLHVLRSTTDAQSIRSNGVVLLASASLPGVLTDVRRELRRRGRDHDLTLVADETVQRRIGSLASLGLPFLN